MPRVLVAAVAFGPACHAAEIRQRGEIVFGRFSTRPAAMRMLGSARHVGVDGLKIENGGGGDSEVEIDGADTELQRGGVSREAVKAGFQVIEQVGEPLHPPRGETVGIFASEETVGRANVLALELAKLKFRYIDVAPSGTRRMVVMPQVPIKDALSIAHEVASAGYHIHFRLP
jgi:hypothetical protein